MKHFFIAQLHFKKLAPNIVSEYHNNSTYLARHALCYKKNSEGEALTFPNISMHILHTTPKTFPRGLTGRICSTIKSFFS